VGLGNTVIGPVHIGNHVNTAQNVVVSGLNHNYQDPERRIDEQGVSTSLITIEDDVWIGANSTVLAGVTIGRHSIVAAGSVVTRSVPPYSVCAGAPAKVVKQYDFEQKAWVKPANNQ
jgi:acetyltransferase-like isoleucine patch superfamily enzyme